MSKAEKEAAARACFVEIWNASTSAGDAAERLGITKQAACSRAWMLRKMWGLPVKKFENGFQKGHARNQMYPAATAQKEIDEVETPVGESLDEGHQEDGGW